MKFGEGQKINKKGRPKESVNIARMARKHALEAVEALVNNLKDESGAIRNAAAKELIDRGYGKAAQVNLNDDGANKLEDILMGYQAKQSDKHTIN